MPSSAEFGRVLDVLVKHVSAALTGSVSSADALAAADREAAVILK